MSGVLEIIRTSASGGSDLRIYAFILKWMDVLVGWGGGGGGRGVMYVSFHLDSRCDLKRDEGILMTVALQLRLH